MSRAVVYLNCRASLEPEKLPTNRGVSKNSILSDDLCEMTGAGENVEFRCTNFRGLWEHNTLQKHT